MASRLLLFATPLAVLILVWQVPANQVLAVRDEIRLADVDAELVDESGNYRPKQLRHHDRSSLTVFAHFDTEGVEPGGRTLTVVGQTVPHNVDIGAANATISLLSKRPLLREPGHTVRDYAGVAEPAHAVTPSVPVTVPYATPTPRRQKPVRSTAADATIVETLRRLSREYWATPDQRPKIEPRLAATADSVYGQPNVHPLPARIVRPGDTLASIADEYDLTWEYLAELNRVEPRRLQVGQALKVVPGPFAAIVERSRHRLTLHANGYVVRFFEVGLGSPDGSGVTSTPTGRFTIANRLTNPTWYGPDGVVAGDDPANPLGEHWLGLADGNGRKTSLGIHGTLAPHTIGRDASRGCIRMKPDDIAAVFRLLPVGAIVEIRE